MKHPLSSFVCKDCHNKVPECTCLPTITINPDYTASNLLERIDELEKRIEKLERI